MAVHMAVACDVYDDVFFMLPFFPRDVLDEILNLIESVSEGFPTYSSVSDALALFNCSSDGKIRPTMHSKRGLSIFKRYLSTCPDKNQAGGGTS